MNNYPKLKVKNTRGILHNIVTGIYLIKVLDKEYKLKKSYLGFVIDNKYYARTTETPNELAFISEYDKWWLKKIEDAKYIIDIRAHLETTVVEVKQNLNKFNELFENTIFYLDYYAHATDEC